MEHTLIQQPLPLPEFPPPSDTECLNLNITVPTSQVSEQKLLVYVFIHGGALAMGSNCWPQNDQAAIVRRSAELGLPCIGVGIKYGCVKSPSKHISSNVVKVIERVYSDF